METVRGLKDLRDLAVQFADDLVDGLLPGRVHVFAGHDGIEELSQCDLCHLQETIRDLQEHRKEGMGNYVDRCDEQTGGVISAFALFCT